MIDKIREIVANIVEIPIAALEPDDELIDIHGMDSLMAFDIAMELENGFEVRIPDQFIREFISVNAIAAIVVTLSLDHKKAS